MPNKKKCQRKHARQRATQRLGLSFGPRRRNKVLQDIWQGRAEFHSKQSNRVSRFVVDVDGEQVLAIYDKHRKEIVTLWPYDPEQEEANNNAENNSDAG